MRCSVITAMLATALSASAADLQIRFTAIQNVLNSQVFEQDGRRYVRGSRTTKCSYAYLENTKVGESNGRLAIRTRFSGQSAVGVFGGCVGLGDAFDLVITATPTYQDGSIVMRDVSVDTSGRDSFYIRRVKAALAKSVPEYVKFPIARVAKDVVEQKRTDMPIMTRLPDFRILQIRVAPNAIVLALDFTLSID